MKAKTHAWVMPKPEPDLFRPDLFEMIEMFHRGGWTDDMKDDPGLARHLGVQLIALANEYEALPRESR